ncbi:MAG: hypothetical protein ACRDL2_18455 [Gaiellaceae bacterium]
MRKKNPLTPELRARFAETMRILEERLAHHERKAAERRKTDGSAA